MTDTTKPGPPHRMMQSSQRCCCGLLLREDQVSKVATNRGTSEQGDR